MEGSQLAQLTHYCWYWAATSTSDAQVALQALEGVQMPSAAAAALWVRFGTNAADPDFLGALINMRQAGVPAQQLGLFGAVLADTSNDTWPSGFAESMAALYALLDSDWRAVADAAADEPQLLHLTSRRYVLASELLPACQQLAQTGLAPEMRLAVIKVAQKCCWKGWRTAISSLAMLNTLLGSWPAAAEAAVEDSELFVLPKTAAMHRIISGLSTAGLEPTHLLPLISHIAGKPWLHREQALAAIAEQLYDGDWRAAALKCLQEPALTDPVSLDRLQHALDRLQRMGAEVASDRGRERVLQFVKGQRGAAQTWRITVPEGTSAEARQAATVAALEAEGFRAVGGQAAQIVSQLAEVSREAGQ